MRWAFRPTSPLTAVPGKGLDDAVSAGEVEGTGPQFSESRLLDVRARTRSALLEIAERFAPGMAEDQGRTIASEVLRERGLRKGWHKVLVRFGVNTTKNFDDPSEPGVVLGDDDIFFIGHRSDLRRAARATRATRSPSATTPRWSGPHADVKALWYEVRDRMGGARDDRIGPVPNSPGERASAMGWVLNLELTGHRLSEFPHERALRRHAVGDRIPARRPPLGARDPDPTSRYAPSAPSSRTSCSTTTGSNGAACRRPELRIRRRRHRHLRTCRRGSAPSTGQNEHRQQEQTRRERTAPCAAWSAY